MRRFTILSLMGLVLALAVGLAALRGANQHWAGGLLLGTLLLLGTALLAAIFGRGASRAGWLGFLLFGGAYLCLTQLAWLDRDIGDKLPTSHALASIHRRVATQQVILRTLNVTTTGGVAPGSGDTAVVQSAPNNSLALGVAASGPGGFSGSFVLGDMVVDSSGASRWRAFLPGAIDREAFDRVGHCLFALLSGLLGAVIARRFAAKEAA